MSAVKPTRWQVKPGTPARLDRIDTKSTPGAPRTREACEALLPAVFDRLGPLHDRLWAERKRSVLLVLQAMDTGGKDGTIKGVLRGLNPQGVRVASFKAPTEIELAHDFLWRVHQATPAQGELGVFNRSHYEDVLIVRVHDIVPKRVWRQRYDLINGFEELLTAAGTTVVKVFLHISKDEQARRLQARLDDPTKRWKFNPDDLAERAYWDEYMKAYEDAITRTSTKHAPWHVVPADKKWYRNWAVATIVTNVLESLDPEYPPPPKDYDKIVIT
jgi:PPK2 family polyphosphate:nucleotide phosphotransferase